MSSLIAWILRAIPFGTIIMYGALGERRKSRQRFLTNVMENASGFWISPSSSLLFHNLQ